MPEQGEADPDPGADLPLQLVLAAQAGRIDRAQRPGEQAKATATLGFIQRAQRLHVG
jgi:hypothetical protein